MKKITLLALCFMLLNNPKLLAQWQLGGNSVSSSQRIGTNTNYSLIFETNGSDRGRITGAGLWGIGTNAPNAKLHINSASGQTPFRVQVNGDTKLLMDQYGKVAIGNSTTSSSYKLDVSGLSSTNNGINVSGLEYAIKTFSRGVGVDGYGLTKGITGRSTEGTGVEGYSENSYAGYFSSWDGTALYAQSYNGFYAALFYGNTFSSGTYYGSDKNIKKNIQEVGNALNIINQLKPKYYEFRDDGKYAALHLPKGNHYGLLAQEVEEVLPNLVKETPHELRDRKSRTALKFTADGTPSLNAEPNVLTESINIKAVNYTELIPILVKAMQEQQATIEKQAAENKEQNAQITELTKLVNKLSLNYNAVPIEKHTTTFLGPCTPNPNSNNTKISYGIPVNVAGAELVISNDAGQRVKQITLNSTGQVEIDTSSLGTGTYFYSLYLNGKLVDTKKMLITR